MMRFLLMLLSLFFYCSTALAAVNCTLLTSNYDTNDTTQYTTATVSPAGDALILLYAIGVDTTGAYGNQTPNNVLGNGLTWEQVNTAFDNGYPYFSVAVWRSMGASPSSGAINIYYANQHTKAVWQVIQCTGVDTGGTNGSAAVVYSNKNALWEVSPFQLPITLNSFGDPTNNAVVCGFAGYSNPSDFTLEGAYTTLAHGNASNETWVAYGVGWKPGEDTSVVGTANAEAMLMGIALEVKASGGAPPAAISRPRITQQ